METAKFEQISKDGIDKLRSLLGPGVDALGGQCITYNAYIGEQEVVVLGYQYAEGGHTFTKPVAVIVDPEVFTVLKVDGEGSRVDGGGVEFPPPLKEDA